jgi:ferredoxin
MENSNSNIDFWENRSEKRRASNKELLLDRNTCISCAACVGTCPDLALEMFGTDLQVFQNQCTYCTICVRICPVGALHIEKK